MKDILEALKDWIIYKLTPKEEVCPKCEAYELWLDRELEEKESLRSVLYANARLIHAEVEPEAEQEFKSIRKHTPMRIRLAQAQAKHKTSLKQEVVVDKGLTEAERIFQENLEKSKESSEPIN